MSGCCAPDVGGGAGAVECATWEGVIEWDVCANAFRSFASLDAACCADADEVYRGKFAMLRACGSVERCADRLGSDTICARGVDALDIIRMFQKRPRNQE
jgi:hypothetical protein